MKSIAKNYVIVLDTETTNNMEDPMVYDCGYAIIDTENGKVVKTRSYVNKDVFCKNNMMESAYYANKIPNYVREIADGSRKNVRFSHIQLMLKRDMKKYNVKEICAHNARFDYKALQTTQRYLTKSENRWFFPYGTVMLDSLKMAKQTFGKDENYINYCRENGFTLANGKTPRLTAEILYRYISGNKDFIESHTGLEDVMIEKDIYLSCLKMNPQVEKRLWA